METVKSINFDQSQILQDICRLHTDGVIECDVTFGNGQFYKNNDVPLPHLRFDIDPQDSETERRCSTNTKLPDSSVNSVIFDPPFLTYVRHGRTGNGEMKMAKRFGGYWTYNELANHYILTLNEMSRILNKKGVLIVKCQDIIHNHKMHATHVNVINWSTPLGFRLLDLFILGAKHRLPSPNKKGLQKHARIFHSYFLVLQKI